MIVASHRRSGTHFLIKSLRMTFGGKVTLFKSHGLADEVLARETRIEYIRGGGRYSPDALSPQPILYIVRDVRDSLTSNFHWWRTSMESKCGGLRPHFSNLTPEAYIRGEVTLDHVPRQHNGCSVTQAHVDLGIFSDPVRFWARHVASFLDTNIPLIRYEDLLLRPRETLLQVAERFGMKRPRFPRAPRKLVGHDPRKGIIGDHKSLFDEPTLQLIADRAGDVMQQLGYALR